MNISLESSGSPVLYVILGLILAIGATILMFTGLVTSKHTTTKTAGSLAIVTCGIPAWVMAGAAVFLLISTAISGGYDTVNKDSFQEYGVNDLIAQGERVETCAPNSLGDKATYTWKLDGSPVVGEVVKEPAEDGACTYALLPKHP